MVLWSALAFPNTFLDTSAVSVEQIPHRRVLRLGFVLVLIAVVVVAIVRIYRHLLGVIILFIHDVVAINVFIVIRLPESQQRVQCWVRKERDQFVCFPAKLVVPSVVVWILIAETAVAVNFQFLALQYQVKRSLFTLVTQSACRRRYFSNIILVRCIRIRRVTAID